MCMTQALWCLVLCVAPLRIQNTSSSIMFHSVLLGVPDTFSSFCSSPSQTTPTTADWNHEYPCATSLEGRQSGYLAESLTQGQAQVARWYERRQRIMECFTWNTTIKQMDLTHQSEIVCLHVQHTLELNLTFLVGQEVSVEGTSLAFKKGCNPMCLSSLVPTPVSLPFLWLLWSHNGRRNPPPVLHTSSFRCPCDRTQTSSLTSTYTNICLWHANEHQVMFATFSSDPLVEDVSSCSLCQSPSVTKQTYVQCRRATESSDCNHE